MNIVICEQCGRALHETERCFHCGSTSLRPGEFSPEIPPEAAETYKKMGSLLAQRKFREVLNLSGTVQKWLGGCGAFYWLRLLAKLECATDLELILRGADLDNEEDYGNAGKYASPEEYQVYAAVQEKMEWLRMELNGAVRRHYRRLRKERNPGAELKKQEEAAQKLGVEMQQHWTELVQVEDQIRQLDLDARLTAETYRQSLKNATQLANDASKDASRLQECSEQQHQALVMRLTAALKLSEEAADVLRRMGEEHPWLEEYARLCARRDEAKQKLEDCVAALNKQNQATRTLREQLSKMEAEQNAMLQALRSGSFGDARALLGKDWDQVLENAQILV